MENDQERNLENLSLLRTRMTLRQLLMTISLRTKRWLKKRKKKKRRRKRSMRRKKKRRRKSRNECLLCFHL